MAAEQVISNHLEPWHSLAGKVVVVTGASAGLGGEFCLDLARAGCRVVAAARRVDRLQSLCDGINAGGSDGGLRAVAVELDVAADGTAIDGYVQKAWDAFGHIDALVNNAGIRGNNWDILNIVGWTFWFFYFFLTQSFFYTAVHWIIDSTF